MKKLFYESPLLTIYAYSVEVGYAMSENGEQYGGGGNPPLSSIPPEGYGFDETPPTGLSSGPDPYVGEQNPGGWWTN